MRIESTGEGEPFDDLALLLGAGLAGGLWLERQAIKVVSRCGASRPRTVLALVSVPFLWWSLRQDLSEDTDHA